MSEYIASVPGAAVTKAAAGTLPAPSATTDGVSLITAKKSWKPHSRAGYSMGLVTLFADGAATVATPELWGFEPTHARWGFISALNGGTTITLSLTRSFYQQINLPTTFDSLAIVGTVGGGNNVGYVLMPIAEIA